MSIVVLAGYDGHPYRIADNAEELARGEGQLKTIERLRAIASTAHEATLSFLMANQGLADPRSALSRLAHLKRSGALIPLQWMDCPHCDGSPTCETCEGTGAIAVPISILHSLCEQVSIQTPH